MSVSRDRSGATPSDVLIYLATISLAVALIYPAWSAREFRSRVAAAAADVETVATAARSSLDASGSWPASSAPGEAPPGMAVLSADGQAVGRTDYRMGWTSWSVVDSVEVRVAPVFAPGDAPPDSAGPVFQPVVRTIGGVVVQSGDTSLLAELVQRFAEQTSFVLDSMWVLVLPERGIARSSVP